MLKSCHDKNEGSYRSEEGEKSLLGDSVQVCELRVGREKKEKVQRC